MLVTDPAFVADIRSVHMGACGRRFPLGNLSPWYCRPCLCVQVFWGVVKVKSSTVFCGKKILNYSNANLVLILAFVQHSSGILWKGLCLLSVAVFSVCGHLSRITEVTCETPVANDHNWVWAPSMEDVERTAIRVFIKTMCRQYLQNFLPLPVGHGGWEEGEPGTLFSSPYRGFLLGK